MKITRRQLRKIISEAMHEGKRIIVDPKGVATPASDAYMSGITKDTAVSALNPKLDSLMQQDNSLRQMARNLAMDMSLEDESLRPDPMTPAEELAVDVLGKEKSGLPDDDVESMPDGQMVFNAIKNKSINILKFLNADFNDTALAQYPGLAHMFDEEASLLGCHNNDTAEFSREKKDAAYTSITEFLYDKKQSGEAQVSHPEAAADREAAFMDHMIVLYDGVKFLYSAYDDYDIVKFCVR